MVSHMFKKLCNNMKHIQKNEMKILKLQHVRWKTGWG